MTPQQWDTTTRDMTFRTDALAKPAARAHMVNGVPVAIAAERAGVSRWAVYKMIRRITVSMEGEV